MTSDLKISGFKYTDANLNLSHQYLFPKILSILNDNKSFSHKRLFELGCGNGSVANLLYKQGWDVSGVDVSEQGIRQANKHYPNLKLYLNSAYDDLVSKYGKFPLVLSLEVVEHVYAPKNYAATLYSLLDNGGVAIISTPFHGYWKNLALAITNKMDAHFTALWDHGHIKFWSIKTMTKLLDDAGFDDLEFKRVGRIPCFAKSMIVIAKKL
jgi:2-polyprenyl-3-methyl-5-hydroxy-6-metoxy-1,4-benzoquinol methylase